MAEQFNAGDAVYVHRYGYGRISKAIITRVTKTQAIIERERYDQRFNRGTGRLVGGGNFDSTRISHPTPALDREWRQRKVRNARLLLARAAEKDDADAIRAAFEKWDRLEQEVEHD